MQPSFFNPEQVLQNTRQELASKYSQIPQLSVGGEYQLSQPVNVRHPTLSLSPVYPPLVSCFSPPSGDFVSNSNPSLNSRRYHSYWPLTNLFYVVLNYPEGLEYF